MRCSNIPWGPFGPKREPPTPGGHLLLMANESDRELWSRIQLGDTDAFGLLFERHVTDVYNFIFRRTASWDAAEDMASAVFLEAWRRRHEISPEHATLRP